MMNDEEICQASSLKNHGNRKWAIREREEGNKRGPANKSVSIFNFSALKLERNCAPHSLFLTLLTVCHFECVSRTARCAAIIHNPWIDFFLNGEGNKLDTCQWRVAQFKKLMHVLWPRIDTLVVSATIDNSMSHVSKFSTIFFNRG